MKKGKFIVFEGLDKLGKTTHSKALVKWLKKCGKEAVWYREPGETSLGKIVRKWVMSNSTEDGVTETLLFIACRNELVKQIKSDLERGIWVVVDRFSDSTRAYQGAGRGVDSKFIEMLLKEVEGDLKADLIYLLDSDVDISSGSSGEVFEKENAEFYARLRKCYLSRLTSKDRKIYCKLDCYKNGKRVEMASMQQRIQQNMRSRFYDEFDF